MKSATEPPNGWAETRRFSGGGLPYEAASANLWSMPRMTAGELTPDVLRSMLGAKRCQAPNGPVFICQI
ncbi:hypothetical protein ColLi_06557 [Colletotrichum liriopes]|uniref:Uncharacterized protein n=1 Tax=Colletotrichum liriopes TaxID=708192 RepID=A0AA37GN44_9PEZI|nr:hypothetical protein ColLi_06557 [Colletotrichum liriopes]